MVNRCHDWDHTWGTICPKVYGWTLLRRFAEINVKWKQTSGQMENPTTLSSPFHRLDGPAEPLVHHHSRRLCYQFLFFDDFEIDGREKLPHAIRDTTRKRTVKWTPGRYQRLDLFIKVLSLLCPNLSDDDGKMEKRHAYRCKEEISSPFINLFSIEDYSREDSNYSS